MNLMKSMKLAESINRLVSNGVLIKWVSEDDYEDIIVDDIQGNRFEIKYHPVKENK